MQTCTASALKTLLGNASISPPSLVRTATKLMPPDLQTLDFADFVTLVFDHPAYMGIDMELDDHRADRVSEQRQPRRYLSVDWSSTDLPTNPLHTLALTTELFEHPEILLGRFTPRQIEQGFMLIAVTRALFVDPIWDSSLPWRPRERLLRATVPLYERLFDVELAIEHIPFMLWDYLLGDRYAERAVDSQASDDDEPFHEVIAEILQQLLRLNGPWSVMGALHGAHHLNHPRALGAVKEWLSNPANGDQQSREYAKQVSTGEAI